MHRIARIVSLLIVMPACIAGSAVGQPAPTISSFSPLSSAIGTSVTINGTGFDATPANNIVYFGATKATVATASSTSLSVTVPIGATFKPITVTVGGLTAYSASPFIVTFAALGTIDLSMLANRVDFGVGPVPNYVELCDFDADGKSDVVVVRGESVGYASFFRNTATSGIINSSTFAAKQDFDAGPYPNAVTTADFDGDGRVDIAVPNRGGTASVLRNVSTIGAISFEARIILPVNPTPGPNDVDACDMDGDGRPDIVVVSDEAQKVTVFRNTSTIGIISFDVPMDLPAGGTLRFGALRDLDGDGLSEIIAANFGGSKVVLFQNQSTPGSLSFAARMDIATGGSWSSLRDVAVGDLDADGKNDIVVNNQNENKVFVYHNTSSMGVLTFDPRVEFSAAGSLTMHPALTDLNGDGKLDIVISNRGSSFVSILRNTSTPGSITTGSFAAKVDFATGSGCEAVAVGDIDGNGLPDVIAQNWTGSSFSVLRNRLGDSYAITTAITGSGTIAPSSPATVTHGANQTFDFTTGSGYAIRAVVADGVDQGVRTNYTFTNVVANHTLAVTFATLPADVYVDATYTSGSCGGHTYGYDAFSAIQPAVEIVADGGRVHVASGAYTEHVSVTKTLSLFGAGASSTTINGGGGGGACLSIAANGCTVSGFALTNGSQGLSLSGNSSRISGLKVYSNTGNGISLSDAHYNAVQGCEVYGHATGAGILLSGSQQNSIAGNRVHDNDYNIKVEGTSRGNTIRANTLVSPATWSVAVESEPLTTTVNFNVFGPANSDKYIRNASSTLSLNAQYNWFGGEASPGAADFSGLVDIQHNYSTDATVSIFPVRYYAPLTSTVMVDVMGLLPAAVYARGVDVTLSWTNDVAIPDQGDAVEGTFFSGFASRQFYFTRPTTSSMRVNTAILGTTTGAGDAALPYVGTIFTQAFQVSAEGTTTLTLSDVQMRDPNNTPILPVVLDPSGGAQIIGDGTPPSITNVLIDNTTLNTDENSDGFDEYVKNTDNVTITATVTDANGVDASKITANLSGFYGGSGHTAENPASYVGNVATWTVTGVSCSPANNVITVSLSATDAAGNTGNGSDNIMADNTAPTAMTNLTSVASSTGGHQHVKLAWTAGTDAHYRGVAIRYNQWSYPEYNRSAVPEPAYPATPAEGTAVSAAPLTGTNYSQAITERNIRYYSGFAVDWAGNSSVLDNSAKDRSTNYYPGDIGSGTGPMPGTTGYDGQVNFEDLFWFSAVYFSTSPGWTTIDPRAAEADCGPTVANKTYGNGHQYAVPHPDGIVDFEDLMIFAMNYMNVMPKLTPPADKHLAQTLGVELQARREQMQTGEYLTVHVYVANDGREVKGTSLTLTFDPAQVRLEGVTNGTLFGPEGDGLYFHREDQGRIQLDAVRLGMDQVVTWSGEVAAVRFKVLQQGSTSVTLQQAIVRTGENTDQPAMVQNQMIELPTTYSLDQNYPNPFNPATTIRFTVEQTGPAKLQIFNVLGQSVATLFDGVAEAGRLYRISWDSHNTASGTYLYRLDSGKRHDVKRMMIVK